MSYNITLISILKFIGSEEERESVHRAFQYSSRRQHQMALYGGEEHNVQFELSPPEGAKVGEELKVVAKLKNTTSEERNVRGKFTAIQAFYTGVRARAIATKDIEVTLSADGGTVFTIHFHILTFPRLRLLSSKVQGCKDFWKLPKPCHVGIH